MATIKDICNRLEGLRIYSEKDKNTFDYIVDLVCLYDSANMQVKGSIIKLADNYLTSLELSMFSRFN